MSDEDFTHPVTIMVDGNERHFDIDDPKLPAWVEDEAFRSDDYPYKEKLKRSKYEDELAALQLELVKMQAWQEKTGQRIVCVFEGRDAAGKGG
ncbi:MAG: polyphosphate kinase 2, partial [Pseudomonadota bacterium]